MTAIDGYVEAPVPSAPPNASTGAEFTCMACGESFATALDQRVHFKSERHVYNTKRKQAGLKPISQEAWERKLRESRGAGTEQKGTAHLKSKKPTRKNTGSDAPPPSNEGSVDSLATEGPLDERCCLFDRQRFQTVEKCLAYMEKTYSFFIPDKEYCLDVPALLAHLAEKVSVSYGCINCNRRFPDLLSVRRHMLDKGHTQLASEAHTRRGKYDEAGTNLLQSELEPFYDFHSSVREVAEKIVDPQQKVASIFRFFDADKDQVLQQHEVAELWAAAKDGAELTEAQYKGACAMADVDPEEGLDVEALGRLYADGFADLDEHFTMLQELLVKRRRKPLKVVEEGDEDEDEADEESEEEEEPETDEEEADEEDGDQIVECEDEDEFEEVMKILGLQPVTILDNGDLRLPNGNVATHRDVQYIYRQRGVRPDQLALSAGNSKPLRRSQLMLSNSTAGCSKIAMSRRQEAKEGKRIIAVLRQKQYHEMRMGLQTNMIQNSKRKTIRTGRGDMSAGR